MVYDDARKLLQILILCIVKPEILACPLLDEFCDVNKCAKIMGHEYPNSYFFVYCNTSSSAGKMPKLRAVKIISLL